MSAPGPGALLQWLARRGTAVCRGCGAELERGAPWCGRCGARVDEQPAAAREPVAATAHAGARPRRSTRWLAAVLLALLGLVLAVGIVREPPPVALLGTAAGASGQSASGPPPAGLRLAWSVPLVTDGGGRTVGGPPRLVVGSERLAIEDRVAELATGRLVARVADVAAVGDDGTGVALRGDELVRVDVLDGTIRGRTPLPDLEPASTAVALRVGDVTVVSGRATGETLLVHDDGTVLARQPGVVLGGVDRAVAAPAAISVRAGPGADADGLLVATDDGRVVADLPATAPMAVDVVGDRALVATAASEALGRPGTGILWGLRLLDARDGRTLARVRTVSAVAPRLLGRFADGTVALATRSGREVGIWRLRPDGGVDAITQVRRNVLRTAPGAGEGALFVGASAMLRSVAMVDGVLVLPDDGAGRAVAIDATGTVRWARPLQGAVAVAADGGHVVLVDVDGRARVLDAADGADVATVPTLAVGHASAAAPVAVVGTDLALARPSGAGLDASLGTVRWVDVMRGDERTVDDVLGDAVPEDEQVSGAWRLVGIDGDATAGATSPVVLRDLGRDVVQLLVPGVGFRNVDLDQPDEGDVASFLARVVGVADGHVALWTDSFEGAAASVTHVVDRTTDEVLHLPGVMGLALRPDLLVAVEAESGLLVGLDPVTGVQRWAVGVPDDVGPAAVDDRSLAHAHLGAVALLDLEDGRTAWRREVDTALDGRIVLGPSYVALVSVTGDVLALGRGDGAPVWRTGLGLPVTAMTGAGDDLLVGTADGVVVHLDERGRVVQRLVVGSGPVRSVAALGATVVAVVDGAVVGLRADGSGVVRRDEVDLP